jgi:hypothetical protein
LANSNEANALLAVNTARKVAASDKARLRGNGLACRGMSPVLLVWGWAWRFWPSPAGRCAGRIAQNLCKLLTLVVGADWEEACDGAVHVLRVYWRQRF